MPLALPFLIPFAEAAGIAIGAVTTGVGLKALSDKVEDYIEDNPENAEKIFAMIMPEQGLASIFNTEADDGEESSEEELGIKVESDPRSTKEIVLEEVARGRGKKGLPARGNFSSKGAVDGAVSITGNVKRGLRDAGRIRQDNDPNYDPNKPKFDWRSRQRKRADGGMMEYANGGGVGSMMEPKKKFIMQGDKKPARNYLGEQKTVTNVPLKWQSGPDAPPTELAYITQKEKNLLLKKDLHGSLKNGPNTGPDGIMSLDSQGDYTRDRSSNNQANANSGSNRADRENARQVENRMKDILTGNISTGQTSAVSNRTRRGAVPEFVDTVDKQGNVTGTNYVGSAYKSYGQPGFFGNLFGGSNPGYRSAYGTGSGIFGNFGGRFNKDANNITYNPETERYESTNQSVGEVKPGMGGRILGGLVSLLTGVPLVGSLIGNQIDKFKPKTYMEKQTPEELSRMRGLQMIDGQLVDTRMLDFDPNAQTQRPTSVPMDSLSLNNFNKQPEYDAYLESQGYI